MAATGIPTQKVTINKENCRYWFGSLLDFNGGILDLPKLLQSIGFENVKISGDTRFDRVVNILEKDNTLDFIAAFKTHTGKNPSEYVKGLPDDIFNNNVDF